MPDTKSAPLIRVDYHPALDGWRGFLCLLVAVYHTSWPSQIRTLSMYQNGSVLIDLFFVMSGLLMYQLYGYRLATTAELKEFVFRRFARLYPLHFVTLLAMVAMAFLQMVAHQVGLARIEPGEVLPFHQGAPENMGAFVAHIFLVHSMGVLDYLTFNDPSWSVSVEFYCYLSFAAMMFWIPPTKKSHLAMVFAAVVAIYIWLSTVKDNMNFHTDLGYFRGIAAFLTGILAARSYTWINKRLSPNPSATAVNVCTILEILLTLGIFVFIHFVDGKGQFAFAPLSFSLILVFTLGLGRLSQLFSHPAMIYLGRISYSIYMWHMLFAYLGGRVYDRIVGPLVMKLTDNQPDSLLIWLGDIAFVPYLIIVVMVSHYSYRYIEVGVRRWLLDWWNSERTSQVPDGTEENEVDAQPVVRESRAASTTSKSV